ncbi:MAG: PIN domain-containing protein [Ferruginibacter sp.]|nr:PIN domain-containing protein [Ferruginibacter sp.]
MSGVKIILDTNALLLFLQGKIKINQSLSSIGISLITKIEYLVNIELQKNDIHLFEELENEINIIDFTNENIDLIKTTISIRKKYKLKLPDAIIAATALANDALLISADNAFAKIHNRNFKYIKK